jgi:hypothetical protein
MKQYLTTVRKESRDSTVKLLMREQTNYLKQKNYARRARSARGKAHSGMQYCGGAG